MPKKPLPRSKRGIAKPLPQTPEGLAALKTLVEASGFDLRSLVATTGYTPWAKIWSGKQRVYPWHLLLLAVVTGVPPRYLAQALRRRPPRPRKGTSD